MSKYLSRLLALVGEKKDSVHVVVSTIAFHDWIEKGVSVSGHDVPEVWFISLSFRVCSQEIAPSGHPNAVMARQRTKVYWNGTCGKTIAYHHKMMTAQNLCDKRVRGWGRKTTTVKRKPFLVQGGHCFRVVRQFLLVFLLHSRQTSCCAAPRMPAPDGWVQITRGPHPLAERWPKIARAASAIAPKPWQPRTPPSMLW